MTRIAMNGAAGRMGRRILAIAMGFSEYKVVGTFESKNSKWFGKEITIEDEHKFMIRELSTAILKQRKEKGVLIDFSAPAGTTTALLTAREAGWGLVIGTTGLDEGTVRLINDCSRKIPIVYTSNMSVGANLMFELVAMAAQKLKNFDAEVAEAHHKHKKDAPSGTAFSLVAAIAEARGWNPKKSIKLRQEGKSDKDRGHKEIGVQVVRAGEIVGDHTVLFAGLSETLEIRHHAQTRTAFGRGALLAAEFVSKKAKGLYTMKEVLGQK